MFVKWLQAFDMRIAKLINAVLDGTLPIPQAPPAVQSCVRLPIYHKAVEILDMPRDKRKDAISQAPAILQPYLEAEIIRVWELRGKPK